MQSTTSGKVKVEIYNEDGSKLKERECEPEGAPSDEDLENGNGAIAIEKGLWEGNSKLKIKVTCLEEQKTLRFISRATKVEVLVHMRGSKEGELSRQFVYDYIENVLKSLEKLLNAEKLYR